MFPLKGVFVYIKKMLPIDLAVLLQTDVEKFQKGEQLPALRVSEHGEQRDDVHPSAVYAVTDRLVLRFFAQIGEK